MVREFPTRRFYLLPNVAWVKASKTYQSNSWFDQVAEDTHMMYLELAKACLGDECCKLLLIKKISRGSEKSLRPEQEQ